MLALVAAKPEKAPKGKYFLPPRSRRRWGPACPSTSTRLDSRVAAVL